MRRPVYDVKAVTCFNTDDGIWRATIQTQKSNKTWTLAGFNTDDGIWRATIGHALFRQCLRWGFNTDDGIWRATMYNHMQGEVCGVVVSIPMTVFGGLQCVVVEWYLQPDDVSIPMTVFGGLQYCAPEPLGLLAPDE